ncbi:MAG: hypothetical protein JWQ98_3186 [Chlorobi bacterium]|nr:hypothetical protein [Chlorobiota bacterium]
MPIIHDMVVSRRKFLMAIPLAVFVGMGNGDKGKKGVRKKKETRVKFRKGQITTTIRGTLKAGEELIYVVAGKADGTLRARVTSPSNVVAFRIESPTGVKVIGEDRISNDWSGKMTESGDYRIFLKGAAAESSTFRLTIFLF